jgi:hypothetical protein
MFEPLVRSLVVHANPSVRYLALTELEGCDPHDPDVQAARDAIPDVPPVRAILEAQYPAGYWMHPDLGVSPRYRATVWQVLFLAQFGVGPIEAVARAVGYLLDATCDEVGAFRLRRGVEGRSPALTGAVLWSLARIGLTEDPRLARSWAWLHDRWAAGTPAPAARVWVLRAAAAWGRDAWIPQLRPGLAFKPLGPLTFPLIHQPDALAGAEAWCEAGPRPDVDPVPPALANLRDALLSHPQRASSRGWPLASIPGKLWFDPGTVGRPNPWVTLRVLRVLRCLLGVG